MTADAAMVSYELSPDGAEFSDPLAIEFRVDPTELGLDPALHITSVDIVQNGNGKEVVITFAGDADKP